MDAQSAVETDFGEVGSGLRLANGAWPIRAQCAKSQTDVARPEPLPDWLHLKAPDTCLPDPVATPTGLGGAKALPGEAGQDEDTAKAYGTEVHRWLETLVDHPETASDGSAAFEEAHRVLTAPHLIHLFAKDGLSEVDLSAFVPILGKRLRGTIDRLIIKDTEIWAVDYKTNATTPISVADIPDGLLRQIGAYAHMLAEIYPDRRIRTAILWTRTGKLMELPHDLVTEALAHTT